jgi:hypothetical protein
VTLSAITADTLSMIATKSPTSKAFPAGVSASKMTTRNSSRQVAWMGFGAVAMARILYVGVSRAMAHARPRLARCGAAPRWCTMVA